MRLLAQLQGFIEENTELEDSFIITSLDNIASRRIAKKCDFVLVGSPREDSEGILLTWKNPNGTL